MLNPQDFFCYTEIHKEAWLLLFDLNQNRDFYAF